MLTRWPSHQRHVAASIPLMYWTLDAGIWRRFGLIFFADNVSEHVMQLGCGPEVEVSHVDFEIRCNKTATDVEHVHCESSHLIFERFLTLHRVLLFFACAKTILFPLHSICIQSRLGNSFHAGHASLIVFTCARPQFECVATNRKSHTSENPYFSIHTPICKSFMPTTRNRALDWNVIEPPNVVRVRTSEYCHDPWLRAMYAKIADAHTHTHAHALTRTREYFQWNFFEYPQNVRRASTR